MGFSMEQIEQFRSDGTARPCGCPPALQCAVSADNPEGHLGDCATLWARRAHEAEQDLVERGLAGPNADLGEGSPVGWEPSDSDSALMA